MKTGETQSLRKHSRIHVDRWPSRKRDGGDDGGVA